MKTFKEFIAELTTLGLNSYRRGAEDVIRKEVDKSKPNWDKVAKRQKGIGMAISKVRNIDVKVKASDSRKKKWKSHPIRIVANENKEDNSI